MKLVPHVWFDTQALEAAHFYAALFPDSAVGAGQTLDDTPSGRVQTVQVRVAGTDFQFLSAGPYHLPNPSVSYLVACETPELVDTLAHSLADGGRFLMPLAAYPFSQRYAWVIDRYGLSWQLMWMEQRHWRQRLTPTLMFVGAHCGAAEEALSTYARLLGGSLGEVTRYGDHESPDRPGTVKHAEATVAGATLAAMDSAHEHPFTFNEAQSLMVLCDTQAEVDGLWAGLSAEPEAEACGWLKDRWGVSWQIVPRVLTELLASSNAERRARVTQAFLRMKKLIIAELEDAARDTAPYGAWVSPIDSSLLVADSLGLQSPWLVNGALYWLERRSADNGRNTLVCERGGSRRELVSAEFHPKTRVHEYGGGAYLPLPDGVVFSRFEDQRLYRLVDGQPARPLTGEAAVRYADAVHDARRRRLIAVREDHRGGGQPENCLVALDLEPAGADAPADSDLGRVLARGHDFYSDPRLTADGTRLCWLTWDHPHMPWDGTSLWVADVFEDGSLSPPALVAGGGAESVFQPHWTAEGLVYVSDRTGWWNLYLWNGDTRALCPRQAEFGRPQWNFRSPTWAEVGPGVLACLSTSDGTWSLGLLTTATGDLKSLELPFTALSDLTADGGWLSFLAGAPDRTTSLVRYEVATGAWTVVQTSREVRLGASWFSMPRAIRVASGRGRTAHALFYPPRSPHFRAPEGDLPPLIVMIHGGPTAATGTSLAYGMQYWTTRGFAVVDVNYGGSTGYGTAYRRLLNGQWGVVDVEDCAAAATWLADQGLVDRRRLVITGGSAGGYTTMAALVFTDVFAAGASHYGVSDLEALAADTHKFESRYLDGLVGPYPAAAELYRQRSPIHHLDGLRVPLIVFQGELDPVVPPNQAEQVVKALRDRHLPVAYLLFEGEYHGFVKGEHVRREYDAELQFYADVFGIALPERVDDLVIENLPRPAASS